MHLSDSHTEESRLLREGRLTHTRTVTTCDSARGAEEEEEEGVRFVVVETGVVRRCHRAHCEGGDYIVGGTRGRGRITTSGIVSSLGITTPYL